MATNNIESLDPALIRPGRIDRKIEFPLPDIKTKRHIFNIHTGKMTLAEDVDLEKVSEQSERPFCGKFTTDIMYILSTNVIPLQN